MHLLADPYCADAGFWSGLHGAISGPALITRILDVFIWDAVALWIWAFGGFSSLLWARTDGVNYEVIKAPPMTIKGLIVSAM
jgi:hypothetical protein